MRTHRLQLAIVPAFGLLLASALVTSPPEPAAAQRGQVEIRTEEVGDGVHVLFGRGGNVGFAVADDGVLMIDDQFEDLAPRIRAAIEEASGGKPIRYLVNTHWHGDHTGGNPIFGQDALVVAHENVRARLAGAEGIEGRKNDPPLADAGLPEVTYGEGGLTVHFGGQPVRVLHFPSAHTDGDSVVWFTRSNVVHLGDLYFSETYPFVDLSSGGSVQGYVDAIAALLEQLPDDAKLIAGHGKPTGKDALREYHAMLVRSVELVRGALEEGKDARQMAEEDLLAELNDRWGGGSFMPPGRYLEILATGLRR